MTDSKKRILIIDDELTTKVNEDKIFKNCGFDAEVFIARTVTDGLDKLKEWAAQGHAADIVDCDYYVRQGSDNLQYVYAPGSANSGDNGVAGIENIMNWAKSQTNDLRPKKYFMHSGAPDQIQDCLDSGYLDDEKKNQITIFSFWEYKDIENLGDGDQQATNNAKTRVFRRYLNTALGGRFPLTGDALRALNPLPEKISLMKAYHEVIDRDLPINEAIRRLDMDDVRKSFSNNIDHDKAEEMGFKLSAPHHPRFDNFVGSPISGCIAFDEEQANALHREGKKAILVLQEFEPQDAHLLSVADGIILLGKGTEHLGPLLANYGIPAALGVGKRSPLIIEVKDGKESLYSKERDVTYPIGSEVSIASGSSLDGVDKDKDLNPGVLYKGALPIKSIEQYQSLYYDYEQVVSWADDLRTKHHGYAVKANADTPEQVEAAIRFKTEAIGLLRTEHMFLAKERMAALQTAILAEEEPERKTAFAALKQFQKGDFLKIFAVAAKVADAADYVSSADQPGDRDKRIEAALRNVSITIRLLDAPPEEFFAPEQVAQLMAKYGAGNLRGVQLAERIPGLYAMQAEAIFEAAKEGHYKGQLDVMIPLIRTPQELRAVKKEIADVAARYGMQDRYHLRAMVETLDAVRHAAEIAKEVDGISFGTNDLTSEALGGIKRNDIAASREWSAENNHVGKSPFLTLSKPVKALMLETVEAARKANPAIDIGICGRQVEADPASLEFCQQLGLDSVSVPATVECLMPSRIMAGQAALNYPQGKTKKIMLPDTQKRFADSASAGTTTPSANTRDSRNTQRDLGL